VISATDALRRRAELASLSNIKLDLETLAAYGCGAAVAGMLVTNHLGTLIWFPAAAVLNGVNEILWPEMSDDEKHALEHSVEILRTAVAKFVKTS
jgi:malate/lactate dehydrogenase